MFSLNYLKSLFGNGKKKSAEPILINILTRTSGRPKSFKICRESIENQSYINFRHIVSYDDVEDLNYINSYNVEKVKVSRKTQQEVNHYFNPGNREFAPYNLYCNDLLRLVNRGWIMFLDDDDMLAHKDVLEMLVSKIEEADKKTLFIWQMEYPNGKLLPPDDLMENEEIKIYNIGSPCFLFHHKYANKLTWDPWKCADYRIIKKLQKLIPKSHWIVHPLVRLNNFGDFGNRNDL